jgi:phosphocarrier protein
MAGPIIKETSMQSFEYTIKDKLGIHARPAGLLVKEAQKFESNVTIETDEKKADGKKLFSLMGLGVKNGHAIKVSADGPDETEAIRGIRIFIEQNL